MRHLRRLVTLRGVFSKLMAGSSSDREHADTVKAMKELMEAIRVESARRIAKLDTIFNDTFQATIKNTENMASEMQNKAAMFEKILRTQSLIKRRTKETEFERSMKVFKKRAESVTNKETLRTDSWTATVKDTSDVYEGSDTSTTMKKSSDSHIDSKCSVGGATSMDDKEVTKSGIITAESENKQSTPTETATSTHRNKKFSLRGIGEATLLRLGQWRKNAARIFHISRTPHEQPRRRTTKRRGLARVKGRTTKRRRPQGTTAIATPNSPNANKLVHANETARQGQKMHVQERQCPNIANSSGEDKQQTTAKSASGTQNADSSSSPSSNNGRIESNPPSAVQSPTARERDRVLPNVTNASVDVKSLTGGASLEHKSKQKHRVKGMASKAKRNTKIHETKITSIPTEQSSSEGTKLDTTSTDQDDNTTPTAKSFNDGIKRGEKDV